MTNEPEQDLERTITLENKQIEQGYTYKYLGQTITIGKDLEVNEITRMTWAAYAKVKDILTFDIPLSPKTNL